MAGCGIDRVLKRETEITEKYDAMEKLKIGVIGISEGAGVSFLTGCLARYLANTRKYSPAVVELGKGGLYDSFGMDKHFAGRTYFCFYHAVTDNKRIRGMRNMDEGINWILKSPDEEKLDLTFEQKLRLVSHAKGDIILCDLSGQAEQDYELMQSMDQIIVVIDPMPSKMLQGYDALCRMKVLESKQENMIYVINKLNRGVNRRQMFDFLKVRKPVFFPLVNVESIYTAEYNCKIPYAMSEVKCLLQNSLGEIVSALNF